MEPPDLRYIVKTTIVRYLACRSDISRDYVVMLEYFRVWGQGVFGDEILSQIIGDFPSELTDELLITLAPPHLKHLKLTNCSGLTCSGLNNAITNCQQLQALDFSECIHLLHPTVFCCIKEKAENVVSLSLENSVVVSDDIVKVALMCCPSLKHLNLSSCKSITDAAFELYNFKNSASSTGSINHISQPGRSLTSVDISGCQTLSTVAVKNLVRLCGAKLTSVNLAWTGISCTALLYLAGLDMEKMARMMHLTNPDVLLSKEVKQESTSFSHDKWDDASQDLLTQSFSDPSITGDFSENTYVCSQSPLNDMEVLSLKDVLPVTCDASLLQSEEMLHLQESNESPDVKCLEELTSDADFIPTCGLLSEKALLNMASEQENLHDEQQVDTEDKETFAYSGGGVLKKGAHSQRTLCWNVCHSIGDEHLRDSRSKDDFNVSTGDKPLKDLKSKDDSNAPTEDEPLKDLKSKDDSCNTDLLPSVQEGSSTSVLQTLTIQNKHDIENLLTLTTAQKANDEFGGDEIFDDEGFDTESHAVSKAGDRFVSSCAIAMSNVKNECDHSSIPLTVANGNEPDYLIMPYEKFEVPTYEQLSVSSGGPKCAESVDPIMTSAGAKFEESIFPIVPSMELHEQIIDKEVELEKPRIFCKDDEGENPNIKETEHDSFPTKACVIPENNESPNCSIIKKEKEFAHPVTKSCWEDNKVSYDSGEEDRESDHLIKCSGIEAPKDRKLLHCTSPRVTDLLEAQAFQPQITSLDITNMCYQSKPLGQVCLKIFSQANKCLKNFAISWSELDDRMLTHVLKNEPELQCLSLVDCEKLSNISLCSIPIHCPKLNTFDLKGMCYVTDHGLLPLTRSNHLHSLSLAEAPITDCTLESIAKGCGSKLKVLDISWCEDVTDRGLSIVANSCCSVHHLGLRQCAASWHTLNTLAERCHLVTSLNIAGLDGLTDTVLGSLAEGMPLLIEIDASWNSSLTDKGISALLRCCKKLKKVVLCGLKLITSQPFLGIIGDLRRWHLLDELWRHNRRFQTSISQGKLALKSCNSEKAKSLGDDIPPRSMSYAPSLRHLVLEYSDKVNDDHLAVIAAVCRGTLFVKDYYGQPVEPKWIFR